MPVKKRWDMVLAARLLQYGAAQKDVARVVGCTSSEISRAKAELLGMEVESMSDTEAEQLIGKKEPFEPEPDAPEIEKASKIVENMVKGMVEGMAEAFVGMVTEDAPAAETVPIPCEGIAAEPMETHRSSPIMVDINIGRGRVHLEAEDPKTLDTLTAMLVVMVEEQTQ